MTNMKTLILFAVSAVVCMGGIVHAQEAATIRLAVKDHRFQPGELHVPANKPIILILKNLDPIPMEFESITLRVEKVVVGNGEGTIRLRPLAPGRYNFFDDFRPETKGVLVAQ
jgi:hypothetical protein